MTRFFASPENIYDDMVMLSVDDIEHIKVLRIRPGELFTICDGSGTDHICRFVGLQVEEGTLFRKGKQNQNDVRVPVSVEVIESRPSSTEPSVDCHMFIAHAKGDRLDYAVAKSVELGAFEIVIFPSERCISTPANIEKRIARLQKIALETAMQCDRGRVPSVSYALSFEDAIEQASCFDLSLFLYELEGSLHLRDALERRRDAMSFSVVTGPEGGFEPHEVAFAQSAGLLSVSVGPRILRCETAPVAALAAIMFQTGNL